MNGLLTQWTGFLLCIFVSLSKCHIGTILRSHCAVSPIAGDQDLSSSLSSATAQTSQKSLNLSGLHAPHLRNEAVALYDLAGFLQLRNPPMGLSIMESGLAVSFIFPVYHRYYSESTPAWMQMWSVSVTKTALKRKLLGLTATQPRASFLRCHYNQRYGQRIQSLIYICVWRCCSGCNSMRAVFLLIQLSHKKLLPWFLSYDQCS